MACWWGWSRVFLGVRYPLDVLAGFALGVAVAGCVLVVFHRLIDPPKDQPIPMIGMWP